MEIYVEIPGNPEMPYVFLNTPGEFCNILTMARLARSGSFGLSTSSYPRGKGNRRRQTFFSDDDYSTYRDLIAGWCDGLAVKVLWEKWRRCLAGSLNP